MKFIFIFLFLFSGKVFSEDALMDILGGRAPNTVNEEIQIDIASSVEKYFSKDVKKQQDFIKHLRKNEFQKALLNWKESSEGNPILEAPFGKALESYLLIQSGFPLLGLEKLFVIEKPQKIHKNLAETLRTYAPESLDSWQYVSARWSPQWEKVFNKEIKVRLLSNPFNFKDEERHLLDTLKMTRLHTSERAYLQWKTVIYFYEKGDILKASKLLSDLMNNKNSPIHEDLMLMTASRLLFEKKHYDSAIQYYQKIKKNSPYWFEAQEEMAWSYLKKGDMDNVSQIIKTLMNPQFQYFVSHETLLLESISALKRCDYKTALNTSKIFKERYMKRVQSLDRILKGEGDSSELEAYEKTIKSNQRWVQGAFRELPHEFLRDYKSYYLIKKIGLYEEERRRYKEFLSKDGKENDFNRLQKEYKVKIEKLNSILKKRVKELTELEIEKIKKAVERMHVVEMQVIHRISRALEKTQRDKLVEKVVKKQANKKVSKGKYDLTFPYQGEIWFDELSHYVHLGGCGNERSEEVKK